MKSHCETDTATPKPDPILEMKNLDFTITLLDSNENISCIQTSVNHKTEPTGIPPLCNRMTGGQMEHFYRQHTTFTDKNVLLFVRL